MSMATSEKSDHEREIDLLMEILDKGCRALSGGTYNRILLKEENQNARLKKVEVRLRQNGVLGLVFYP